MEYILSQRGGRLLVLNNYLYRKKGSNKNVEYFACIEENCNAKVNVTLGPWRLAVKGEHLHQDHYLEIKRRRFVSSLKEEVSQYDPSHLRVCVINC